MTAELVLHRGEHLVRTRIGIARRQPV